MKYLAIAGALCAMAQPAAAQDCAALGLDSDFLTEHFCAQLEALAGDGTGTTRSVTTDGALTSLPDEPWATIGVVQEAYRADPRKTLELIARIKGAGGLQPLENN